MKNINIILLSFITIIFTVCCDRTPPDSGAGFSKNFIQVYVEPLTAEFHVGRSIEFYGNRFIYFGFEGGDEIHNHHTHDAERYEALSIRYNDLTYNSDLVPYSNWALSEPISEISVTCDRDFAGYPAGESLNGIIKFQGTSAYEYINNGYKFDKPYERPEGFILNYYDWDGYKPIFEFIDDLKPEDLTLLDGFSGYFLYFTELPEKGMYTINVTLKFGDRGEVTKSIEAYFE